jgi:hypothetical protein
MTYDWACEQEKHGGNKTDDFCGSVTSVRRGEPDKDGIQRNNFTLRRMWLNGRRGIYVKLQPHEFANQEVGISLSIHQARWLSEMLAKAVACAEEFQIREDQRRAKERQKRQAKKAAKDS